MYWSGGCFTETIQKEIVSLFTKERQWAGSVKVTCRGDGSPCRLGCELDGLLDYFSKAMA